MNKRRGFITVATGDWYCYLAQNLVISYKLFGNCDYPFYVITDKDGEKKLKKYFDKVIVLEKPNYNFLDKIEVYHNSPFDETVFLDADMNIIKDISFVFDEFEKNGSEVSCYGTLIDITENNKPIHFGDAAVKCFNLTKYIRFGGGIYYYKRSPAADKVIDCIYNDLMPNYDKYDMLHIPAYFGNDIRRMADEPLLGLAMVVCNMKPLNNVEHLMRYYRGNMMETLKWDMDKKDCSFNWWGEIVHPYITHYATYNTWTYKYYRLNVELRDRYHKLPKFLRYCHLPFATILWVLMPRQLKAFWKWLKPHFTKEWVRHHFNNMKK